MMFYGAVIIRQFRSRPWMSTLQEANSIKWSVENSNTVCYELRLAAPPTELIIANAHLNW